MFRTTLTFLRPLSHLKARVSVASSFSSPLLPTALSRTYQISTKPPNPKATHPSSPNPNPTPDHGSSDTGPHLDIGPRGGTNTHTVDKPHGLDAQSAAAYKGLSARRLAEEDPLERTAQAGSVGSKSATLKEWEKVFPEKPPGPIIGMQDERGGVEGPEHHGLSPGEGIKGAAKELHYGRLNFGSVMYRLLGT